MRPLESDRVASHRVGTRKTTPATRIEATPAGFAFAQNTSRRCGDRQLRQSIKDRLDTLSKCRHTDRWLTGFVWRSRYEMRQWTSSYGKRNRQKQCRLAVGAKNKLFTRKRHVFWTSRVLKQSQLIYLANCHFARSWRKSSEQKTAAIENM